MKSIGMIELNSLARGVLVSDYMLKAAEVRLIFARPVCPGKYMVMITGDVGAVKAAVADGEAIGKNFVVGSLLIANIHEQLIPAINASLEIQDVNALGIMEFFSITAAVTAADEAAKAAAVHLMEIRLGMGIGGKSFVVLSGDVSAVEAAVEAGLAEATEAGNVVSSCVIPAPDRELFYSLV